LRILGQIGTTIALGLVFDTLIVRSFMTPSIAALLGRWFWWPQAVRPRPASQMLQPYGSRHVVRQLLLWEDEDSVREMDTNTRTFVSSDAKRPAPELLGFKRESGQHFDFAFEPVRARQPAVRSDQDDIQSLSQRHVRRVVWSNSLP
jgi:hypothetical protein